MAYFFGYIVGVTSAGAALAGLLIVRLTIWSALFWVAAWAFPELDVLAMKNLGVSFATVGAAFGLLSLWAK